MSYRISAAKGFGWQTAFKFAAALVILAKISVLARLLTPTQFGLFSLVTIALGLSEAATQTGVNVILLQSPKPITYFLDTAWVIAIIRGFLIGAIIVLVGIGMSFYFEQPELVPLISLVALVPIIKGFINPAVITWRKELQFFKETTYYFSLAIVDAALAILLGWWLHSVVALILAMIGAALFEALVSLFVLKVKPQLRYVREAGQEILGSAKWLSMASVMGYLNDNADDFIIRSVTNTYQLGLYHNAYALSHKANYDLAQSVQHGTFPIFSKISEDTQRLRKGFVRTLISTTGIIFAASMPLLLFPELIVSIVFGDQWLAIIPLLPWLLAAGILHSLALVGYTLFLAKGTYKILNLHQVVNFILMIVLVAVLTESYGLQGGVIGLVIARLVALPIVAYGSYRTLTIKQ